MKGSPLDAGPWPFAGTSRIGTNNDAPSALPGRAREWTHDPAIATGREYGLQRRLMLQLRERLRLAPVADSHEATRGNIYAHLATATTAVALIGYLGYVVYPRSGPQTGGRFARGGV